MAFLDGIMIFLFILFMIFIFGGYHKNKSAQREMNSKKSNEFSKVNKLEESSKENQTEKENN